MNITERIARFVFEYDYRGIHREAFLRIKRSILDYVGVTLAGVFEESPTIVRRFVDTMGGKPQASIWGTLKKTSVILAALSNGTAAHSLDYDDIDQVILGHPSIQLLPGLFALSEFNHKSGEKLILAYLVGFEIGAKLGMALNPGHVSQGWLPIGTLGTLMQTVACAKLLDLNLNQIKMAVGIATNLASGLRCNNGTMAKHLLSGLVASNGITSAMLAKDGLTSNQNAIEDQFGFFENFCRGDISLLDKTLDTLGNPLEIIQSGISHKPYPTCAASHSAIDCALHLVQNYEVDPEEIDEIQVTVNSITKYMLIHTRPKTPAQAKHSLEYCIARAILEGRMGLQQLEFSKIQEPNVHALIEKIRPFYKDYTGEDKNDQSAEMNLRMKNGSEYSYRVRSARGTPKNPLTDEFILEKFQQCCAGVLSEPAIMRLQDLLLELEAVEDVNEIISALN